MSYFTEEFKPKSGNASTHKNWESLITFTKIVRIFFELKRALDTDKINLDLGDENIAGSLVSRSILGRSGRFLATWPQVDFLGRP